VGRLAKSTDEEIIAAGIAIENEGKPVSAFAIRNVLKGGCSDRIRLLWNEFIEQRGSRELEVDVANKIDLPPEIQDLLEKSSILFQENAQISDTSFQVGMLKHQIHRSKLERSNIRSPFQVGMPEHQIHRSKLERSNIRDTVPSWNAQQQIHCSKLERLVFLYAVKPTKTKPE
jgi:hypothetical protein